MVVLCLDYMLHSGKVYRSGQLHCVADFGCGGGGGGGGGGRGGSIWSLPMR